MNGQIVRETKVASRPAAVVGWLHSLPVKSDRNIAQLMQPGRFRPVHSPREIRAMLTTRKLIQSKPQDSENSLRGILRGSS